MSLHLKEFCSGPLSNNVILVYESKSRKCLLFDPSYAIEDVYQFIEHGHLEVQAILFTHGHFDHFAGLDYLLSKLPTHPQLGLHPADLTLWRDGGGSRQFGFAILPPCDPGNLLQHGQRIHLAEFEIEIRHTPGHSPGSVIYYIPDLNTVIAGDLIFYHGIGRTDLDGGSFESLKRSVWSQVFSLPPDTILIPGHGPHTTVAEELEFNPFLGTDDEFDN